MLSPTSYELLSIVATGEVDIHTLRQGLVARNGGVANRLLLNSMFELLAHKAVSWRIFKQSGHLGKTLDADPHFFATFWLESFGPKGPQSQEADDVTAYLEITAKGERLLKKCDKNQALYDAVREE